MMNNSSGISSKRTLLYAFVGFFVVASLGVFYLGLKQSEALAQSVTRLGNSFGSLMQQSNQQQPIPFSGGIHQYTLSEVYKYENDFEPMDDPGVIRFIQQRYLMYPSKSAVGLSGPEVHKSQVGQSQYVDKLLKGKRNGFFIEVGAHNGVFLSNSYFFEKYRGWTGLLMEPNSLPFQNIPPNRQGSYAINACLATSKKTKKVKYYTDVTAEYSKISGTGKSGVTNVISSFPLYSILKAIGVDTVDYFSLDIEGLELDVLKTIPWDKIRINVLTIEYRASPGTPNLGTVTVQRNKAFLDYFTKLSIYKHVATLSALDLVFVRTDLK